jgi:uroporphyrinogen-III synthase
VVTSARSALYVALAREALAPGARVLSVGTATARALEDEDTLVDLTGEGGAADLAGEISVGPVLLLGAASMRGELRDALAIRGIEVEHLACYETVPAELTASDELNLREADVVFIGAPSAWRVAAAFIEPASWVVVPGPSTAEVIEREHARVIEGWSPQVVSRLVAL